MSGGCVDAVRQETDLAFDGFQSESSASLRVFDANKVPEHAISWVRDVSIIVIPDVNWRLHAEIILKGCIAEQRSSLRVPLLSAFTRENYGVTEQQERVTNNTFLFANNNLVLSCSNDVIPN